MEMMVSILSKRKVLSFTEEQYNHIENNNS